MSEKRSAMHDELGEGMGDEVFVDFIGPSSRCDAKRP
jgi:hypothetical protein